MWPMTWLLYFFFNFFLVFKILFMSHPGTPDLASFWLSSNGHQQLLRSFVFFFLSQVSVSQTIFMCPSLRQEDAVLGNQGLGSIPHNSYGYRWGKQQTGFSEEIWNSHPRREKNKHWTVHSECPFNSNDVFWSSSNLVSVHYVTLVHNLKDLPW